MYSGAVYINVQMPGEQIGHYSRTGAWHRTKTGWTLTTKFDITGIIIFSTKKYIYNNKKPV